MNQLKNWAFQKWKTVRPGPLATLSGRRSADSTLRPPSALLVFLIGALGVQPGMSANWYVDNAALGSAQTGTNWANAWTNLNSIVWGGGGVRPGDTLFISGGTASKIYTNSWSVGVSGTSNNPVRIAIDAANPNHNGVVIFDYNYAGDKADLAGITCLQDYVTFDGSVGGECHLVIANLRHQLDRHAAVGLYADGTTGVVIDYLASTNCNNPIRLARATAARVSHCNLRQVRGDVAISLAGSTGSWDANLVCSNVIEMLYNSNLPPGATGFYGGPDGIHCSDGVSIFANTFVEKTTPVFTSDQHPDMIQATGNYLKVYANEFINVGDSVIDYDCWSSLNPHDVRIYNNVFRMTNAIDSYPEYFRLYSSAGAIASIVNFKIFNNTFVDNSTWKVIRFDTFNGHPTASGNEIKNNIFYNCGQDEYRQVVYIERSRAFNERSFVLDGNVYFHPTNKAYVFYGANYPASAWVKQFEPHGSTNAPVFVTYTPFGVLNDFHLAGSDAVAVNAGLDLSGYFSTDKDGSARPQGPAWDIGACEFGGGWFAPGNCVLAVAPRRMDFGQVAVGAEKDAVFTVQNLGNSTLVGAAKVPPPFAVVAGGSYSLESRQSQTVTIRYKPVVPGSALERVSFTGGGGAIATVNGAAIGGPP